MLVKYKNFMRYRLSCGCWVSELLEARGNTMKCPRHWYRVFIVETYDIRDESDR